MVEKRGSKGKAKTKWEFGGLGKGKKKEEGGGVPRGIKGRREGDGSRVREEGNG